MQTANKHYRIQLPTSLNKKKTYTTFRIYDRTSETSYNRFCKTATRNRTAIMTRLIGNNSQSLNVENLSRYVRRIMARYTSCSKYTVPEMSPFSTHTAFVAISE